MIARGIYALAALAIFAIEVVIALFVRDAFVRPYVGDLLAVILVYAALRAATPLNLASAVVATLSIALTIEIAQAFDLLGKLGLGGNEVAQIVLGGAFDVLDVLAYACGVVLIFVTEAMGKKRA
jgi:Protein of unknown function (DUF2809)